MWAEKAYMLPAWFNVFSVAIRLFGGAQYCWGVLSGKAQPNPITWFLWGLTPLITFFASLQYGFQPQSLVLLAMAASPLAVSALALLLHRSREHFTPFALLCGALALVGIVLWQITSIPELAIMFSIVADIFATLPTLEKAYHRPASEYAWPYFMSIISMAITLLTVQTWVFAVYAFPLYMLLVNIVLFAFAMFPIRKLVRRLKLVGRLERLDD
jgi:hypothetical protein